MSWGFISAGIAVVSVAYSAYESDQAKQEQQAAAREQQQLSNLNAASAEAESREAQRRLEKEQTTTESMAKARAAASGVDISGGSTGGYLADMEAENELQLDWMKRSGLSQVGLIKAGGQAAYKAGMAQAETTGNAWIGQGLSTVGGMAAGAFTSPTTTSSGLSGESLFSVK